MEADDDLWFSPLLKTARVVPREPEPLWEVRSADHHTWSALLRYHGEWGVEAQIYRERELCHRVAIRQEGRGSRVGGGGAGRTPDPVFRLRLAPLVTSQNLKAPPAVPLGDSWMKAEPTELFQTHALNGWTAEPHRQCTTTRSGSSRVTL